MSWKDYVDSHMGDLTQVEVAQRVGVSQAAVSRWRRGQQGVDAGVAIKFARAVGDKPLAALVAAGFLTPEEARQRPAATPALDSLTEVELLEEVLERMKKTGGEHGGDTAATKTQGVRALPTARDARKAKAEHMSRMQDHAAWDDD